MYSKTQLIVELFKAIFRHFGKELELIDPSQTATDP